MARTVPDVCLLLSAMVSDDARDPLATTVHGRTIRRAEDFAVPARIDLSRLRVALTPDFGFAPTERHIAEVFAEKTGLFRHVFARAEDATPDCTGADEAFEVLRASRSSPAISTRCARARRTSGRTCAPMSRRACATRPPTSRGRRHCRPRCIAAGRTFFQHWDVILTPSITISPRSWRELYPAEIDGKPTRTYFHWLALAYAVTLPGIRRCRCRSASIGTACRSACRSSARAAAMRSCCRSRRNWRRCWPAMPAPRARCRTSRGSKSARPISEMAGFLGFD